MNLRQLSANAQTRLEHERLQSVEPLRIMCVGASITMGEGVNGGYRLPLEQMLHGAGASVQFVGRSSSNSQGMFSPYHDGYPGLRVEQIEEGVPGTCEPIACGVRSLKPNTILVLCGTNDVRQNFALSGASERFDHLLGTLHEAAPQSRIFVSSIPPYMHFDDAVRRYNAGIAAAVRTRATNGEKVDFVDNYAALTSGVDISPDRTHPNQIGYHKIARNWFHALAPDASQVAFALSDVGARALNGHFCLGYQITTKTAFRIIDLGLYCAGRQLANDHAVGVFNESGTLLASTLVGRAHKPSGAFAYAKLSAPLSLEAGRTYLFVSNSVGLPALAETDALVDPLFFDNPRFCFDHNIALEVTDADTKRLVFPDTEIHDLNAAVGYFGPIFRVAP